MYLHKDRTRSVEILRKFILDATKGTSRKVRCLRTDQAAEHMSEDFKAEIKKNGISLEYSAAMDHFQNGYAEKCIKDMCTMARCMLEYGGVARDMWGWAVRYAAYVMNRLVLRNMKVSPYEMRYHCEPEMDKIKIFGCAAYVARDKNESDFIKDPKLDPRGISGTFIGIAEDGGEIQGGAIKGYVVWSLETGARIITSTQVSFDESRFPRIMGVTEWEFAMQTRIDKCKATISAMTFETEKKDRHPFCFEADERKYCKEQRKGKFNPEQFIGMNVHVNHDKQKRNGRIVSFHKRNRTWKVELLETADDGTDYVYDTPEQLAKTNKVQFAEKIQDFQDRQFLRRDKNKGEHVPEVIVTHLTTYDEAEILKYDEATRNTQEILEKAVFLNAAQMKKAPIARLDQDPRSYKEAMNSSLASEWKKACADEVNGLDKLQTWEAVPWFEGAAPIGSKWVFRTKRLADGTFEKTKARLVIRGDSQTPGIDYGEIFAPVAHNTLARLLFSVSAACDLEVDLVDICQAFLNADLQEEIYMKPAPGVNQILGIPEGHLLRLKRNLYGLKQAPRNWALTFLKWMEEQEGFVKASTDDCLLKREYEKDGKKVFILLLMYVNDNVIISNDREELDCFKQRMHEKFKIVDKGLIKDYLGVQVQRSRENRTLKIVQEGYVNEILTSVGIKLSNPLKYDMPLPAGTILRKNQEGPYELDVYRSLIGSLIYLAQWTRIDIAHAVSVLAAHM